MVADIVEGSAEPHFIISLGGSVESLAANWTRARSLAGKLVALDRKPAADIRLIGRVAQLLRTLSADAVVAHHIGPLLYGGLGSRLAGVKRLIYVEHDCWHYQQSPKHQHIFRFCDRLLRPDLAAVSQPVADSLRSLGKRNVTLLPPGVCTGKFRPSAKRGARLRHGLPLEAKLIGCVGRLEVIKGHAGLVKAMVNLPDDTGLVLAGDGTEKTALESLATSIGVRSRIHFLGHCEDVAALYPAFDILALPSLGEGLPRAVIEAQACGVPVVASDVGGVASALEPCSGLLVPPNDTAALSQALVTALARSVPPSQLRDFVKSNFNLARTMILLRQLTEPQ